MQKVKFIHFDQIMFKQVHQKYFIQEQNDQQGHRVDCDIQFCGIYQFCTITSEQLIG